ncbi:MAG: hypothetical protein RIB61_17210 [Roseicyclus sp.]
MPDLVPVPFPENIPVATRTGAARGLDRLASTARPGIARGGVKARAIRPGRLGYAGHRLNGTLEQKGGPWPIRTQSLQR